MHYIIVFDLISFVSSLAALFILINGWKHNLQREIKLLLVCLLVFILLYNLCLFLEWSGINKRLDTVEDLIGALTPMWWAFLFYAFLQYITRRDLHQSERKYRTLVESSTDAVLIMDNGRNITHCNQACLDLFGYRKEEVEGKSIRIIHRSDESFNSFGETAYPMIERDGYFRSEWEFMRKDGTVFPVETVTSPIRSTEGMIQDYIAVIRDIKERKRAEEELQESEEKFRTICSSAQDAIIMMDNEGNISLWNNAAEDIFAFSPEEAIGKNLHKLIAPKTLYEDYKKAFVAFQKTGRGSAIGKTLELPAIKKDGKQIPIELSLSAVKLKDRWHSVGMIRDITSHKQAEEELKMAKEFAETANKAKSEFLANMSHEIRTPMNGILGFADLLLEEELTQEQREAAETIKKSGESLLALINDILDLSKVESQKIEIETIPFNVESLILDVGELVNTNLGEKPVEINCITGDVYANLLGDPTRLRQIITNLTGNAIKFIEEGEIVISVVTQNEDDKQTTLKFSVRDTGIGIPEDKLETIFESFKQADGSTTREYGGTGLGLTISKKLALLMGGDIWVESEVGKGSVFYFTAIFKKDLDTSEEIHPVDVGQLEGKPILIVDDNETALKIVANIVKRIGMVPVLARSGEEALTHFGIQNTEFGMENKRSRAENGSEDKSTIRNPQSAMDIAIIDIMMPGISGHELAGKISELTGGWTKMIALSSNVALGSAAETQKSGFTGFIPKPVRRQVLIDLIRTILGIGEKQPKDIVTRHRVKEIMTHDVRILYAEDNRVNQMLGKKIFKRMGYNKVEIAPDGLEALKKVKENGPYDIVFMDIQMPNMDGMEATKEIRKWEETPHSSQSTEKNEDPNLSAMSYQLSAQSGHIPIVALTANAMKGDQEKYLEAGMDEYLSKPFKKEDIQRVIREWVHKRKVQGEVPEIKRILIVEDEEKMRKSIIRLLSREMPSTKAITAGDGFDATAKLGSFMPELILTDIRMPRMDGVEFIRYIRNTERYAKTRIIAMTGLHKDDPRVSAVQEAGVEKVVYKPWEDEDLILAIKEALRN